MNKAKSLVILAGGKGTRIAKYLKNVPKPMAVFNKFYFLEYLIKNFAKYDFKKIYILTGYKNEIIHKKFNNRKFNFIKIECIKEKTPMGTGGCLFKLKKKIKEDFILINGDTIFDININILVKNLKKNSICNLALLKKDKNNQSLKLNNLNLKNNKIFFNKNGNYVNGGIYYFKKKFLNYVTNSFCSLEDDILPKLIEKKRVCGTIFNNFFLDIGTPEKFKVSSKILLKYFTRPAAFLDRDGVINYDFGYVHKFKDFKLKPKVIESLKLLKKNGYYIFLITNQAGIAKGFFKEIDFINLQRNIKSLFSKKDVFIDDIKYSPYHIKGIIKKYKKNSGFRKPGNLMIKNIRRTWHLNNDRSFMIGDKLSDLKTAKKSKLYFEYVEKNLEKQVNRIIKKFNSY